jgi:gliding motility associated protien GldN
MYNSGRNNRILALMLLAATSFSGLMAQATESTYSGTVTGMSFIDAKQPAPLKTRAEDIAWKRDVYRIVDLTLGENAALYYPIEATAEKKNLFSSLFEALAQNKVKAYEYLDGREVFTDTYAIKFKDLLKRFDIPFKEKTDARRPGVSIFDIEGVDIPTSEVVTFYVKETVFLDARTSTIRTKTIALCPVLVRFDENEGTRKFPMFWIPMEAVKDFLSTQAIAPDSLNSAERYTLYDYFNLRRYKGDIYKVSSPKNQTIYEYCTTPEEIKAEQVRLEKELGMVENALWEPNEKEVKEARDKVALETKETGKKKK